MGRDGVSCKSDLGLVRTDFFLQGGLDRANQLDPKGEFSLNHHCGESRN